MVQTYAHQISIVHSIDKDTDFGVRYRDNSHNALGVIYRYPDIIILGIRASNLSVDAG